MEMQIIGATTFDPVADMLEGLINGYGARKILEGLADVFQDMAFEAEPPFELIWKTRARILRATARRNAFQNIVPEEI